MNGKMMLFRDQYGKCIVARTVRELRKKHGGGHVSRMFSDTDKGCVHVGYVVGKSWYTMYAAVQIPA